MTAHTDDRVSAVDLLRGLLYVHNRANANTGEAHRTGAAVEALIELIVDAGIVDREAFEARRAEASDRLRRDFVERGMAVAVQEFPVGKYEFEGGAEIDCDARLSLCGAACCKLPLALSAEDVEEGVIGWDPGQPYMIRHEDDRYCTHMDRCTHRCGVYEQRPIPCRGYDCRQDSRIWVDFERRIVNPQIHDPDWPATIASGAA
jgi:putative zinc- or iron-chelating protein